MSAETATANKILIVDDNEVILKTISLKLQAAGYRVVTALDGAEAVAAVRKDSPDLILLDISFPQDVGGVEWDGFRIMAWLHRLETVKKTPVIIITGGEDAKNKARAVAAGAVAYFHKPIDHDDLLKVMRDILNSNKP
jgi:CheY-like chemotaxis protein